MGSITCLVETDCIIQEKHISDSVQMFESCSCWRTRLFQTTHLVRPVFEVNVCDSVQPLYIHFDKRVLLVHEGHSSLNMLGLRDPLTSILTAKLKEVRQVGRDAFAWQIREDTLTQQLSATFNQWLKPRQIALKPLLREVCCDAYTRFKSSYEAAHANKPCFGVRRVKFNLGE